VRRRYVGTRLERVGGRQGTGDERERGGHRRGREREGKTTPLGPDGVPSGQGGPPDGEQEHEDDGDDPVAVGPPRAEQRAGDVEHGGPDERGGARRAGGDDDERDDEGGEPHEQEGGGEEVRRRRGGTRRGEQPGHGVEQRPEGLEGGARAPGRDRPRRVGAVEDDERAGPAEPDAGDGDGPAAHPEREAEGREPEGHEGGEREQRDGPRRP